MKPPLTEAIILKAAHAYHDRTGKWPSANSMGADLDFGYPESWSNVNSALFSGSRGLPLVGITIRRLLISYGLKVGKHMPSKKGNRWNGPMALTEEMIVSAAKDYYMQNEKWPSASTKGTVFEKDNWARINSALTAGSRGLPGGTTLSKLLSEHRLH